MKQTLTAAAAAFVIAFVTFPAIASETRQGSTSYETSLTQTGILAAPGAYLGNLRISVTPEGLVNGWYRPSDRQFIPVTGNLKDGKLWLYVGERGDLTITAQVQKDGSLVGTAFEQMRRVDATGAVRPTTYDFSASPQTSGQSTY
jgi:hypothetical protein